MTPNLSQQAKDVMNPVDGRRLPTEVPPKPDLF